MVSSRLIVVAALCLIVAVINTTGQCTSTACSTYFPGSTCCYGLGCCMSGSGCCPNDPNYCCPTTHPVCCGNQSGCCPTGYYCCENNTKCCSYSRIGGTVAIVAKQGGTAKSSK